MLFLESYLCIYVNTYKRSRDGHKLIRSGGEGITTFIFYSILICVALNNKERLSYIFKISEKRKIFPLLRQARTGNRSLELYLGFATSSLFFK